MPFDESPKDPKDLKQRLQLKPINGQKSMFENIPKPPTPQEHQQKVQEMGDKMAGYKRKAAELFLQFIKAIGDKTLPQNKTMFNIEIEKEMLQSMVQLAIDINNDPNEQEGMGSLTWITCLFKTCLSQRDRINELEFGLHLLQKKLEGSALTEFIQKEVAKAIAANDQKNQGIDKKSNGG